MITIIEKKFIVCPKCKKGEFGIQHLLNGWGPEKQRQRFGPWYCSECGLGVCFDIHPDGDVTLENPMPAQEKSVYRQYVLVELPVRERPIRMLCKHSRFSPELTEESRSYTRFRFEENTSTVNILNEAVCATDVLDTKLIDIFDDPDKGEQALHRLDFPESEA